MENTAEQLEPIPIGGVQSHQVMAVWDRVEPMLRRIVQPDTGHSIDSVLTGLQMAKMQLWVIGDFQGVVVTSIENRPSGQCIMAINYIVGHHMDEWLDEWIELQESYAKAHNCVAIEFAGRRGWKKALERWPEYKTSHTVYRRELNDG